MFKNSNRYIQLYDISKGDQYYQQPIVKVPSEKIQPRDITKEERIKITLVIANECTHEVKQSRESRDCRVAH